ncbi:MAG: hypothetical protein KAR79_04185 [Simkaniaceae bacterium]|nr:hypothetical protein [Simkaniaceae bacterium]
MTNSVAEGLRSNISEDQQSQFKQLLKPEANKAYLTRVYTKIDEFNLSKTWNEESTNRTETVKKCAMLVLKFSGNSFLTAAKVIAYPVAVLLLPLGSWIENMSIDFKNARFEEKGAIFVKAATEFVGHGNLLDAKYNISRNSQVAGDLARVNGSANMNQNAIDIGARSAKLITTANQWAKVVQNKSDGISQDDRLNFFNIAIAELLETVPTQFKADVAINARIAIAEAFKSSTITSLRADCKLTTAELDTIVNGYMSLLPADQINVQAVRDDLINEIVGDEAIQGSAIRKKDALLQELANLRDLSKVQTATDTTLKASEARLIALDTEINTLENEIQQKMNAVGTALAEVDENVAGVNRHAYFSGINADREKVALLNTNITSLFGERTHGANRQPYIEVDFVNNDGEFEITLNAIGNRPLTTRRNADNDDIPVNEGIIAKLAALRDERAEHIGNVQNILGTLQREAEKREDGIREGDNKFRGAAQVIADLQGLADVFGANVLNPNAALETDLLNGLYQAQDLRAEGNALHDDKFNQIDRTNLQASDARTFEQKLAALKLAADAKNQTVYTLVQSQVDVDQMIRLCDVVGAQVNNSAVDGRAHATHDYIWGEGDDRRDGVIRDNLLPAIATLQADLAREEAERARAAAASQASA